jgi:outer membrane receptor for ferrienterochelin and colicins
MPVISSLASIYGLSGIPNSLIERVEIIKGPASSLYGSEAVGGLINIITKKIDNAPVISIDINSTTWLEQNADIAFKLRVGKKTTCLTGLNYFRFNNVYDFNNDNFTDISILNKFSFFQKWNFERKRV